MAPAEGAVARMEVLHVPPAASHGKVPLIRQENPIPPDVSGTSIIRAWAEEQSRFGLVDQYCGPVVGGPPYSPAATVINPRQRGRVRDSILDTKVEMRFHRIWEQLLFVS